MNQNVYKMVTDRIEEKKQLARANFLRAVADFEGPGEPMNRRAALDGLIAHMDAAGIDIEDFKPNSEAGDASVIQSHITAGLRMYPIGVGHLRLKVVHLAEEIATANGSLALSRYRFVPMDGAQNQKDVDELTAVIESYNSLTPGTSPAGLRILNSQGVQSGGIAMRGSAENLGERFRLYAIQLAKIETDILLKRHEAELDLNRRETFLKRLGFATSTN